MSGGEAELLAWLADEFSAGGSSAVVLGVGDDMAVVRSSGGDVLLGSDMILDGVHFDSSEHSLTAIGYKAMSCVLSDCAAMAVRPVSAVVSVALPGGWRLEDSKLLFGGLREAAATFDCSIVGGDTTSWRQRLAVDVAIMGEPYPGIEPVRRSGARVGDVLMVTGCLGGSRLGRHMSFRPRVVEARRICEQWGERVHAMMDISDGLSLDVHRLCRASGVGAVLDEQSVLDVVHDDARRLSAMDGESPLHHSLTDGEDFELLLAVDPCVKDDGVDGVTLHRVGRIAAGGVLIRRADGVEERLPATGYEHLT